ncbi:MAG: hypothetical protein QW470_05650 [Candidatus Caldarchaeum sp.]
MAQELSPKERPELLNLHQGLRNIVTVLREFLDTEDYSHLEKAVNILESIKANKHYHTLSGRLDLENNLKAMYEIYRTYGDKMDDFMHGRLLDQVVYTIVRTNIISTGLEFKQKRMRKG